MKKKLAKIIMVIIALILLFPVPIRYKDGGTVKYQAILYSVTDYKSLRGIDGYDTGIEIKILGTYSIDDDVLTMKTNDNNYTYVFQIDGDSLIFQQDKSSFVDLTNDRFGLKVIDKAKFHLVED